MIQLNKYMTQEETLDILKMGQNVFLTGPAGSGKTFVLNSYISYLKKNNISVAVTASTGIAATHMNGRTIHSWSGVGKKKTLEKKDFYKIVNHVPIQNRISKAKVLIIDEVSMLEAKVIDLVEKVCRTIRKNDSAFGGLQVVLSGDLFQLPPVHRKGEPKPNFVYESNAWARARFVVCYLQKQYRQEDLQFLTILNSIREDTVNEDVFSRLMERYQKNIQGVLKPTKLYTHNADVDAINSFELAQINNSPYTYNMTSWGESDLVKNLKRDCLAPEILELKKGALVMFVKNNFDRGYVNGTLGTVIDFDKDSNYPIIKTRAGNDIIASPTSWSFEEDDIVLAQISQIPLRLAWAITVHKSQGMTLDYAEIDLSKAFTEGMGYVALSRVRTLSGIKLMGLNDISLKVNTEIKEQDYELRTLSDDAQNEVNSMDPLKKEKIKNDIIQLWAEVREESDDHLDFN